MNMNMCLVLAAIWIWWAVIVTPGAWVCSSSLSVTEDGHNNNLYNKVEFTITGCTKKSYSAFLESLRTNLSSGTSMYEIPLLPIPSTSQKDLLLVELFDWNSEPITLVLDRTNAYVIAYQAQNRYYLLSDTPANPQLYGKNSYKLTFNGSYPDLQRVANENRENINLGINELAQAINTLYFWSPPKVETSVARFLIVLIQMVSETARYGAIEKRVINTILDNRYDKFCPGVGVMDLETNWKTLSTAVQQSIKGNFTQAVKIQVNIQTTVEILNVTTARDFCGLALLLALRQSQASILHLNIMSMLDIDG